MTQLQMSLPFELAFALPEPADFVTLDRWMRDVLEVPWENPVVPQAAELPEAPAAWLWRALVLARTLLQASRIPLFDAPAIEQLRADSSGDWFARVRMPSIEYLQPQCQQSAIEASLALCRWAATREPDDGAVAAFHGMVETDVLPRLGRFLPAGQSSLPVLKAVHALGIPAIHLGNGTFQLGWGARARRIDRSLTDRDSVIGMRLAQDKLATGRLLSAGGLPAPQHVQVGNIEQAMAAMQELGAPVVVKPPNRDGGVGVTMDVGDAAGMGIALAEAAAAAGGGPVLVERQAPGWCHRLFVSQGRLLYALKRLPIGVRGDGVQSIADLVATAVAADRRRPQWLRLGVPPLDDLALASLQRLGWTPLSVPAAGTLVPLRRIESTRWGGIDEDVTGIVHPDNVAAATKAVALLGLDVAGVDMMAADLSVPWHESGAVINEVNAAPLLGGGDISRGKLAEFLSRLLGDGAGRIPVEVFAEPSNAARRQKELSKAGLRCWRIVPEGVFGAKGEAVPMAADGTALRLRAVLLDATVDAVVVVANEQEIGLVPGVSFPAPAAHESKAAAPKRQRR